MVQIEWRIAFRKSCLNKLVFVFQEHGKVAVEVLGARSAGLLTAAKPRGVRRASLQPRLEVSSYLQGTLEQKRDIVNKSLPCFCPTSPKRDVFSLFFKIVIKTSIVIEMFRLSFDRKTSRRSGKLTDYFSLSLNV